MRGQHEQRHAKKNAEAVGCGNPCAAYAPKSVTLCQTWGLMCSVDINSASHNHKVCCLLNAPAGTQQQTLLQRSWSLKSFRGN